MIRVRRRRGAPSIVSIDNPQRARGRDSSCSGVRDPGAAVVVVVFVVSGVGMSCRSWFKQRCSSIQARRAPEARRTGCGGVGSGAVVVVVVGAVAPLVSSIGAFRRRAYRPGQVLSVPHSTVYVNVYFAQRNWLQLRSKDTEGDSKMTTGG